MVDIFGTKIKIYMNFKLTFASRMGSSKKPSGIGCSGAVCVLSDCFSFDVDGSVNSET